MHVISALVLSAAALQGAQDAPPARVDVEPESVRVEAEESTRLRAVAYAGSDARLDEVPIRWISLTPDVVSVSQEGTVTALRPGEGRIAAVAPGNIVGFARVEVPQVEPSELVLTSPEEDLLAGTSLPLRARATTRFGDRLDVAEIAFESLHPEVAEVDATGRVFARRAGTARIQARVDDVSDEVVVRVLEADGVSFRLTPSAERVRTGDVVRFRIETTGDDRQVRVLPDWAVSGAGARIETEGPEGVFVAEEPGLYRVSAVVGEDVTRHGTVRVDPRRTEAELVEVGRGPISSHNSGDMWVFEGVDGRDYVYVGTFMYDWMKAWDVTDPSSPVLTDSVQVDARRINDVKIHPNSRLGIITREGASDRRNGIVLLDLSDPAHPTILSEYTETVSGGVHNVWIDGEHDLVYAAHNGTSDVHILDISDPEEVREVGRWGLDREVKTLHDVIVQDGYAYLSYWHDGLVMLDVGAGTHGGTPTEPAFVSRFAYPEGHTHVAWRYGRYLFVGDEIFPEDWNPERPIEARGFIHVLDYSDPESPREVARYEVPEAGAHNVWVEDDRLYVGYYQAGLRVVDVSGELRGDLYAQGRELARFLPIDEHMVVPNWPMTWGAQLFEGDIYSSDLSSGLWITRLVTP